MPRHLPTTLAEAYGLGVIRKGPKRPATLAPPSLLEQEFDNLWAFLKQPALKPEIPFDDERGWRIDRADDVAKVGVELEGGIWNQGRHTRPEGYEEDCRKYNAATARGWLIFRITAGMLHNDPIGSLQPIIDAIKRARGVTDNG